MMDLTPLTSLTCNNDTDLFKTLRETLPNQFPFKVECLLVGMLTLLTQ